MRRWGHVGVEVVGCGRIDVSDVVCSPSSQASVDIGLERRPDAKKESANNLVLLSLKTARAPKI